MTKSIAAAPRGRLTPYVRPVESPAQQATLSIRGASPKPSGVPERAVGLFVAAGFSALVWVALISGIATLIAWVQSLA